MNKYILLTIALFLLNNVLIWYQLNSQLVWDWAKGNKQTGAGVYTIGTMNEDSGFYDDSGEGRPTPSFVLKNANDDEVPMVIHTVPSSKDVDRINSLQDGNSDNNRMTNGCINGTCTALTELYENPDVGEGTKVFILPEDGRIYRGWKKGGHGEINLKDAIIESSNTFFFSLAYQTEIEELRAHLSNFGFGKNVCDDCFMPDNGLLPSPRWKMNTHNFGWFKGDTVNVGVGQGYINATPIQLAYYSAFLATKGNINKFSFVQDSKNANKNIFNSKNITNIDWDNIHESMIGVIESPKGTAGRLRSLKDYVIAAKSGTVELVSTETKEDYQIIRETEGKRDHAIIIAFAPMPNPKYAISVVIENGESGGSVAGPVAVAVLNSLVKND